MKASKRHAWDPSAPILETPILETLGSRRVSFDAIVAETSRPLAAAAPADGSFPEVVRSSWQWMTAPRQRRFRNVFYEVCAVGAAGMLLAYAAALAGALCAALRQKSQTRAKPAG